MLSAVDETLFHEEDGWLSGGRMGGAHDLDKDTYRYNVGDSWLVSTTQRLDECTTCM